MSDNDQDMKRPLSLGRPGGKLELRRPIESGQVRQSFPHGRSKTVTVEVRKKRAPVPGQPERPEAPPAETARPAAAPQAQPARRHAVLSTHGLTAGERAARASALQGAIRADEEAKKQAVVDEVRQREQEQQFQIEAGAAPRRGDARRRKAEEENRRKTDEESQRKTDDESKRKAEEESRREVAERAGKAAADKVAALQIAGKVKPEEETEEEAPARRGPRGVEVKKVPTPARGATSRAGATGKLTVTSVAQRERRRAQAQPRFGAPRTASARSCARCRRSRSRIKIVREVVVPETITVQELANRMAERGADVIKTLMTMGVMATINQVIDADTAELVVAEFGHTPEARRRDPTSRSASSGEADVEEHAGAAAAGRHHHGPCRSRQDLAARRACAAPMSPAARPAASPSISAPIRSR